VQPCLIQIGYFCLSHKHIFLSKSARRTAGHTVHEAVQLTCKPRT